MLITVILAFHINYFVSFEIAGQDIKGRGIFVVDIGVLFVESFFKMCVGEFVIRCVLIKAVAVVEVASYIMRYVYLVVYNFDSFFL